MESSRGQFDRAARMVLAVVFSCVASGCVPYLPERSLISRPQSVPASTPVTRDDTRTQPVAAQSRPYAESARSEPARGDAFARIAADLLATLEPGRRIALQPFAAAESPIPLSVAQGFNDALARAIESADTGNVIVAREELPRLLAEAEEFGVVADQAALLASARADVLLIGTLNPAQGGVDLSYKAFDVRSGRQLASSRPIFRAVDAAASRGIPLDQALAAAAAALAEQAPGMRAVESLGIHHQHTDAQTVLGGYIGRELVGRLVERINARSGLPAAVLAPDRAVPGAFLLSGTTWDFGADIELRVSLKGDGGQAASYGVHIRRDTLPRSLQSQPALPTLERTANAGPFALQLTSDRGRRPVYAAGDSAKLLIQAADDGYLYCFHQASAQAGGELSRIFPNSYHREARIQGGARIRIPGDDMNFALKVQGPAGVEYVRCFVLDREMETAVSAAFPGSRASLDDVSRTLRASQAGRLSEATLVMTIEDRPR